MLLMRLSPILTITAAALLCAGCEPSDGADGEVAAKSDSGGAFASKPAAVAVDSAVVHVKESAANARKPDLDSHLPPSAVAWADIGGWTGTGDKGTERFAVRADEWRLVGTSSRLAKEGESWVIVKVFDADKNQVGTFSIEEPGTDTTYLHTEPGLYYLTVGTREAKWSLSAQERRPPAERADSAQ
jgi:hypothetical protein